MRQKMYKSGKIWVCASIVSLTVVAVMGVSEAEVANADSTNHVGSISQQSSSDISTLPSDGQYTTSDNGLSYKYVENGNPVKGLYLDQNSQLRYFNETDGTQTKGDIVSVDDKYYYFDKDSGQGHQVPSDNSGHYVQKNGAFMYQQQDGDLAKGLHLVDGNIRYFDEQTGVQSKGAPANIGGVEYYFESGQGTLTTAVNLNDQERRGLVTEGNKLHYFDPKTGEQVKGRQVAANGATYYFNWNGDGEYLFTNIDDNPNRVTIRENATNSLNPEDYKNMVDGFFTADTWYRPKFILDNGESWRKSNADEFRPLITTWWPNKEVEVNYLKLMQTNGLLKNQSDYNIYNDQAVLDAATHSAQVEIERRIKTENSTNWLNDLLFKGDTNHPSFINQQFVWNIRSEYPGQGDAWFQGGYLQYGNSILTPKSNSNYRQAGNTFDFLLANDIDNQNPVVQAEALNWIHYLMNFGSITANDANANFDSIRVDAVDFVHNDVLNRTYDYLRKEFNLTQSDAIANGHLSIVEAGVDAGTTAYNNDALIESNYRELIKSALFCDNNGKNTSLSSLIKDVDSGLVLADHANYSTDDGVPNYSIVHAHDKGIQENVGRAITDTTGANWTNFTPQQLADRLKAYYQDQRLSDKKYNSYNIPASYAIMLTNKGTVPRIYYGDMYQDDGQYMQNKSIYFDAISSLMKARKSYVAGGQTMSVDNNGFLKSVRFGKNAMTAADAGTSETRNQGLGLIVGNNIDMVVPDGQSVTLDMGVAHRNQAYRALMLTTADGLITYDSDENAPVAYTDDNGVLTFTNANINNQKNTAILSVQNPQVYGYLAAWVPVGASMNQDARTFSSNYKINDGKVLHSNALLDSNVMFEGFSNFQPNPTNHDEMTNVVIAKNAKMFKDWGITSFELAPQYRSSQDHTFLDSTIDNGYAFSDRYDLGFDKPTKYGDVNDLREAIKSLHNNGMQVMADVVLNQVYNLPGKEVVSAERVGVYGNLVDLPFGKQLYVVNTIGGGEYQKKYGGVFLSELKAKYPEIFEAKQYQYYLKNYANNGQAYLSVASATRSNIPSDQFIKQWSAKYMNGTNILGRGMGFVLKNWNTGSYFRLAGGDSTLPQELLFQYGWRQNSDGSYSYYDRGNGKLATNLQVIDGRYLMFSSDGIQVKGGWGDNGDGTWSYYNSDTGDRLTGNQVIEGRHLCFTVDGVQIKGGWGYNGDGTWSYYNSDTGDRLTGNQVIEGRHLCFTADGVQIKGGWGYNGDGTWSYYNSDTGDRVTGLQIIDGRYLMFSSDGVQVKGGWGYNGDGTWSYYNSDTGDRVTGLQIIDGRYLMFSSDGVQVKGGWGYNGDGTWSYYNSDTGDRLTGNQVIEGRHLCFTADGVQIKGGWGYNGDGTWSYYNADTGDRVTGLQIIDGRYLMFSSDGVQVKGGWGYNGDGTWSYYNSDTGDRLTGNQVIEGRHLCFTVDGVQIKGGWGYNGDGTWSYYNADTGDRVTGLQTIDGRYLMFSSDGVQVKGGWGSNGDGTWSYYNFDTGDRLTGNQIIDGRHLCFTDDGIQIKGGWGYNEDGTWSYYNATTGDRVVNN
ncbi:glycoside hydrolase family 70 protein [Convivina intestini]|uniref:glycoside hydrolase family 70 protein n=1 Tax=Convivina intestini TaxID=1505726 RepID=UPI00200E8861|nr:glycoside hydrolase family 70 protein [Convivina intestini]CAH1856511.1 Glucosyltransferase-SI [Convivina intestini]